MLLVAAPARADLRVEAVNLHNPVFADRAPDATAKSGENFVIAPPPKRLAGFVGDVVSVPFAVTTTSAVETRLTAQLLDGDKEVARVGTDRRRDIRLLKALDVNVEGNSNASCSCPAGQVPQQQGKRQACVADASASEEQTPRECPSLSERKQLASTFVRSAPFSIKDPLEPLSNASSVRLEPGRTELFVVEVPVVAELPRRPLKLRFVVRAEGVEVTATATLAVMPLRLERFPTMDLSYWLSEDPRDLVARPEQAPLNARWGADWWSEEHWRLIERAADELARMGTTNAFVPLFVRSPSGLDARALVTTRCITGNQDASQRARGSDRGAKDLDDVARWQFAFDFTDFHRWVRAFRQAGFRQFEGAHLFANSGELPQILECDLYSNESDSQPYSRAFRFLPRAATGDDDNKRGQRRREDIYREVFLPQFLRQLGSELKKAGIEKDYLQHVIDENASDKAAMAAYASGVDVVRKHLPGVRTIDAINKYSALEYAGVTDLPVFHLVLLYDDQLDRKGMLKQIRDQFKGRKYFYNTAFRRGGPNRFLDTNPLDSRATGWLALELGFDGFLYWASNQYRYPTAKDLSAVGRPRDWTPYGYSQGPRPAGVISPAYGAGGNWILYPTSAGLIDSLRARRLRDGLLDHWIYQQALAKCRKSDDSSCASRLASLRERLTGRPDRIADLPADPASYDQAREEMLRILER